MTERAYQVPRCGFCGASNGEATFLIVNHLAGADHYICGDCAVLCVNLANSKEQEAKQDEVRRLGT